jgi:ribosomal protein S18 acetylase RimI-like enzyme
VTTTTNFDEALAWAEEVMGELNVPRVWIPRSRFIRASRHGNHLSFTRESRDGEFALSTSLDLPIEDSWNEFVLPQSIDKATVLARGNLRFEDGWETHAIHARSFGVSSEVIEDPATIESFLQEHAPRSSARPGSREIDFWVAVRTPDGEIAGVAAITHWESGETMLSSVGTHSQMRSLGYGKKVVEGALSVAYDRGYDRINLVVLSDNLPAIKVYERVGFSLLGKFNTFTRV